MRTQNDRVERGRDGASLYNNSLRDWETDICPMSYSRNGVQYPDHNYARIVASDNGQPISKPFALRSYSPLSNQQFLGTIEAAIAGAGHSLELIGTVSDRAKRFASFRLDGLAGFEAGGRSFESSIYFGDGLDQKTVWFYGFATSCIQCMNRFMLSLRGASSREKHTSGLVVRLPEIAKIIGEAVGVQREFAEAFEGLATVPVSKADARNVYAGFIGGNAEELSTRALSTVDTLESLFSRGRGNRGESRADLFSGVTDFYTHSSTIGRNNSKMRQFESSEFGTGAQRKSAFFDIVRDDSQFATVLAKGAQLLQVS
jgi:hypothetical protein